MKTFCFLYSREKFGAEDDSRIRAINGKDIDEAARKMVQFLERHNWENPDLDYEAASGGEYFDLYELGEDHPIYEYLP